MSDADKPMTLDDGEFREGRDPVMRRLFGEDSKEGAFSDLNDDDSAKDDEDGVDQAPLP